MVVKKYVKRVAKKAGRAVKRRYFAGKGYSKPKIGKMMSDIKYLKSVLNPEKKQVQFTWTDGQVGQCSGNSNGYFAQDITPAPAQGITSTTRNGNSIKVHSSYLKFQFQAQSAANGTPINIRVMLVKVIGEPETHTTVVPSMFKPNAFITGGSIIDYNSDRREDNFKHFVILRSKVFRIRPNMHTGQISVITGGFGMKYKSHHVKFAADGSQTVSDGQLMLIMLADNGNINSSSASTLGGTASTAVNTGAWLQYDINHWYYDN